MQPTLFPLATAMRKSLSIRGYSLLEIRCDPLLLKKATQYVYDRLEDRRFQPKIALTFPLARATEAYKYLESNEQVGKIVITI